MKIDMRRKKIVGQYGFCWDSVYGLRIAGRQVTDQVMGESSGPCAGFPGRGLGLGTRVCQKCVGQDLGVCSVGWLQIDSRVSTKRGNMVRLST